MDVTDAGKVLVRITSLGQSYRAGDIEEQVVWLGESPAKTRR